MPGVGAKGVREILESHGDLSDYHLRLNWMSTPQKEGDELLEDIYHTAAELKEYSDSFEFNISCPNTTHGSRDARKLYQDGLDAMLRTIAPVVKGKSLYVKVSPDVDRDVVKQTLEVCSHYDIVGFTISNTTRLHKNPYGNVFGSGSGDYVYPLALAAQKLFAEEIAQNYSDKGWTINACGGISTLARAKERIQIGDVREIHLYTPLIYEGPKIVRILRRGLAVGK